MIYKGRVMALHLVGNAHILACALSLPEQGGLHFTEMITMSNNCCAPVVNP